jgi:hypothetical protein
MSYVRRDRFVSSQGRGPLSNVSSALRHRPTVYDDYNDDDDVYTTHYYYYLLLLLLLLLYTLHDILIHMHTHTHTHTHIHIHTLTHTHTTRPDPRRSVAEADAEEWTRRETRTAHKLDAFFTTSHRRRHIV